MADMNKTEIKSYIKDEIKKRVESSVKEEIAKILKKDPSFEKRVGELTSNVLVKFYQTLYQRSNAWKNGLY